MSQSATAQRRRLDPVAIFPFLAWSQRMSGAQMRADLLAGLTGALVVLPQGVAFATIAGMPPQY
jgi:sulfate permease, SulP family